VIEFKFVTNFLYFKDQVRRTNQNFTWKIYRRELEHQGGLEETEYWVLVTKTHKQNEPGDTAAVCVVLIADSTSRCEALITDCPSRSVAQIAS
jgi:hypothetical protein